MLMTMMVLLIAMVLMMLVVSIVVMVLMMLTVGVTWVGQKPPPTTHLLEVGRCN